MDKDDIGVNSTEPFLESRNYKKDMWEIICYFNLCEFSVEIVPNLGGEHIDKRKYNCSGVQAGCFVKFHHGTSVKCQWYLE